jgi:hypothetical protein
MLHINNVQVKIYWKHTKFATQFIEGIFLTTKLGPERVVQVCSHIILYILYNASGCVGARIRIYSLQMN